MIETPTSGTISVPVTGGSLVAGLRGAGIPVLLLHGLSANRSTWDRLLELLPPTVLTVAPDLVGRGASPAGAGASFRLVDEAERVERLLDQLGLERPVLVGHSHGAAIAVAVAARRPVRGLLLISPVSPAINRPWVLELLRLQRLRGIASRLLRLFRRPLTRYILERRVYANPAHVNAATVERYSGPYEVPERAWSLAGALRDWHPSEVGGCAPMAGVPSAVLTGALDRRIPAATAKAWAGQLGAECAVLPDCGHGLPEERPDEVARRLLELTSHSVGERAET
jgi:pimeloyl-ACP methyl ester carboxylesterase